MPSRRGDGSLVFKVVVYGPSISENSQVLEWLNKKENRGIQQRTDSTGQTIMKFFDRGIKGVSNVIFQVFTARRQQELSFQFLKGTDAVIFTWDSLIDEWEENILCLKELLLFFGERLILTNLSPEVPMVVLATKRDLENIVDIGKIRKALDIAKLNHVLIYESILEMGINIERSFGHLNREAVLTHYRKIDGARQLKKRRKAPSYELEQNIERVKPVEELSTEKLDVQNKVELVQFKEGTKPVEKQFSEKLDVLDKKKIKLDKLLKEKLEFLDKIIFVSYSRKDNDIFQIPKISEELKKYFKEVLYYEGEKYHNIIEYMNDNIERCDIFLCFWSKNAIKSRYIKIEWEAAIQGEKKIIPVFIDLSYVPLPLKPYQGVQFREGEFKENVVEIYSVIKKQMFKEIRGVQIIGTDAEIIQEIEKVADKQINFSVKNYRVSKIELGYSKLKTLPESIGNLTALQILNFGLNMISSLPESISNLSLLLELDLGINNISTLPDSIGNLTSLQRLNLGVNNISTLPESIGNLSSLQTLNLKENQLITLPDSIGNLSSLRDFNMIKNGLLELPESIGNLSSLEIFHLTWNKLKSLPASIAFLPSLKAIYLLGNPLLKKPDRLTKDILKVLKKRGVY